MKLIVEAIFVAVITGITGLLLSTIIMYVSDRKFSIKKYHFWPYVLLSFILTGFILHIGFEISGANKWYCKHGNACQL